MISSGINLVMTVIGFAVSTMFIVFVCTRLICARIQLNASRRSFPISSRSDPNVLEQGLHGLDPAVVASFPTKKYSDEFFTSTEDANCTVCLAEYQKVDILRILPYCGHFFHATCIDVWLRQHSTCPMCRISLHGSLERKAFMPPVSSLAIRAQHRVGPLSSHSYHRFLPDHRLSSRSHDSRRIDPIQVDPLAPEGDGAPTGEGISSLTEGDQIPKDSGNKLVESPSNSQVLNP